MLIQSLIGILMLVIVLALSLAFLPLISATSAALGSLLSRAASRLVDALYLTHKDKKNEDPGSRIRDSAQRLTATKSYT